MNKPNNRADMKTLYLVRHAEAAPASRVLPDHDRPLTERGRRDAATLGERLAQRVARPDLLLASSATRARGTAELLAQALGIARERIVVNERLYNASADELLGELAQLDAQPPLQPHCVMVVAHNPGLSDLAHHFASDITHLPTCAVVEVALAVQAWAEIGEAKPTRLVVDFPKKA